MLKWVDFQAWRRMDELRHSPIFKFLKKGLVMVSTNGIYTYGICPHHWHPDHDYSYIVFLNEVGTRKLRKRQTGCIVAEIEKRKKGIKTQRS